MPSSGPMIFIAWHRPSDSSAWRAITRGDEASVLATAQAMNMAACRLSGHPVAGEWCVRPVGNPPWEAREPIQQSLFV